MNTALFVFGRTPDLAYLELQTFFPSATRIHSSIARVETEEDLHGFLSYLGGTIKVVSDVREVGQLSSAVFADILSQYGQSDVTFGISSIDVDVPKHIAFSVKKSLVESGRHVRFIEAKHADQLSSVVVAKQNVIEMVVAKNRSGYIIGVTKDVQNFEEWNKQDYGRPSIDPKAGMLPPKVARMIVNIALPPEQNNQHRDKASVLDPFCGVGTILMESLLMGHNVVGTDVAKNAIEKSKKNIDWLFEVYPQTRGLTASVYEGDATHISTILPNDSIDAVVTEPFMGDTSIQAIADPKVLAQKVKNTLKGLEKLYIGCLKEWYTVLKKKAKIVIALPSYTITGREQTVKNVIDRCENLGYTVLQGPIEYSRPQAVVKRQFYILQKV